MKLIEYIKEKFVFMVINIVMTLSGVVILKALKVDTYAIVFISILNLIGVFSCYIYDYFNRKKYYDKYQEIVYKEKPMIYIYSPIRIVALRNKFKNIYPSSLGGITHNIEEIYIGE